jgi:hypothetical protein
MIPLTPSVAVLLVVSLATGLASCRPGRNADETRIRLS